MSSPEEPKCSDRECPGRDHCEKDEKIHRGLGMTCQEIDQLLENLQDGKSPLTR